MAPPSHTPSPRCHHQSHSHSQAQAQTQTQTELASYHFTRPSTSSLPRSYKRAKNTPSPSSPVPRGPPPSSGHAGPSRAKQTRPTVARRLVEASPQYWKADGRRREMSVPLLSHELSHFSLTHSSPPDMVSQGTASHTPPVSTKNFSPSPPRPAGTPRSTSHFGPSRTPFATALPKDHTYPSTAPLPQLSTFLGSPFSSKTARGDYTYHQESPSYQGTRSAVTEKGGFGHTQFDQSGSEWLENNDGLPRSHRRGSLYQHPDLPEGLPQPPARLRRWTNGSTSSMDELSGSGASTASLLSLARNSMEHNSRPNIITSWDEEAQCVEEQEEETATPSRPLFTKPSTEHVVHMSKRSHESVRLPTCGSAPKATFQSPMPRSHNGRLLGDFLSATPGEGRSAANDSDKPARSPLTTLLPRLLSSKKSTSMRERAIRRVSSGLEVAEDEDVMTDTEDALSSSQKSTLRGRGKNIWDRARFVTSRNPMEGGDHETSLGKGIGLGIRRGPLNSILRGAEQGIDLARSLSSESSGDIELSPSRPLSNKGSTSMFAKPSATPFSPTSSTLYNTASKSAFHARRKSITIPSLLKASLAGPTSPSANAIRSAKPRPMLRRGITAPAHSHTHSQTPNGSSFLSADSAFHTPTAVLFGDVRPSPAAFASTGLVKKRSGIQGVEIPKFGAGVDSEPVGESKRDRAAAQHGMSRTIEPPSPISPIKPLKLTRPVLSTSLTGTSTSTTSASTSTSGSGSTSAHTVNSNAAYIQHAQKTRGLRRKGSQMFTASGSIGSIDMMRSDSNRSARGGTSPATPTKPGLQLTPIGLGITTPSPTSHHAMYPFASSNSILSTPPHSDAPSEAFEPSSMEKYCGLPARVRQISNSYQAGQRGPIARASNPMLAASYKASIHVVPETPGQGQVASSNHNLFGTGTHPRRHGHGHGHNKLRATTRLEKDFTVVQTLGSGAFSQVLKVAEKATGKLFAVKAGKPYTGAKNRLRQLEEVSILRQLSLNPHPNIIEYVDSWETHSRLYIRTSLAECGDLSKFLELLGDHGGLGEARVWKTLVELASGVSHIHRHNFLHLDIKPSNILINREGGLVIADLGMAVICSSDSQGTMLGGYSPALPEKDEQGGFVWTEPTATATATASTSTSTSESQATTPGPDEENRDRGRMDVIPSPILDREVEGDREYLCPEALAGEQIGKGADVFSLGMVVLESAMNVVLPSNGDGWVKLRNDDFSDLNEHYRARAGPTSPSGAARAHDHGHGDEQAGQGDQYDPSVPVISEALLRVMGGMMRSDPAERWSMDDLWAEGVVQRVMASARGRALVDEPEGWLGVVLGECE